MTILSGGILVRAASTAKDPSILSDAVPMIIQNRYFGNEGGLAIGRAFATYAEIYKRNATVATLVMKLAASTAGIPLKTYQQDGKQQDDVTDTSPLGLLMKNPNRKHSPAFFWNWTVSTFEIYGEALWVKSRPRPGAPPTELWPMHPANVLTQRSEDGTLWYLVYLGHPGSGQEPVLAYPEQDIIHFRMYNPDNQVRGLSRLESLRASVASDVAMQDMQASFWANGARPSVLLQAPGEMSDDAFKRLRAEWNSTHAGAASWGKTAILESGVTATMLQLNANELQYIDSRKLNRDEACSLYDVPPPVIHILDKATFSNITEQMRSMYRDTMAPRFAAYESDINTQLTPDFHPQRDVSVKFFIEDKLRGDIEAQMAMYEQGIRSAVFTPGEVRERMNLPDAGVDTHELYANFQLIPLGSAKLRPAGTPPVPPPPGEVVPDESNPATIGTDSVPIKSVPRLCNECEQVSEAFSRRGWCRSCEGKASRRKEIAV